MKRKYYIFIIVVVLMATIFVASANAEVKEASLNNKVLFKPEFIPNVCPDGNGWEKKPVDAQSYPYAAPSGKLIAQWCYKAGTELRWGTILPPAGSVTLSSNVLNPQGNAFLDISHASFLLVLIPPEVCEDPEATNYGEIGECECPPSQTCDLFLNFDNYFCSSCPGVPGCDWSKAGDGSLAVRMSNKINMVTIKIGDHVVTLNKGEKYPHITADGTIVWKDAFVHVKGNQWILNPPDSQVRFPDGNQEIRITAYSDLEGCDITVILQKNICNEPCYIE